MLDGATYTIYVEGLTPAMADKFQEVLQIGIDLWNRDHPNAQATPLGKAWDTPHPMPIGIGYKEADDEPTKDD